jgi:predicted ATPase
MDTRQEAWVMLVVAMGSATFVTRVRLSDYKSIHACDVPLGPLTFLVGPNGSGKSNFLDSLHFITDALNDSLRHALRGRGGIAEVVRRSPQHSSAFTIQLEFSLRTGHSGHYAVTVSQPRGTVRSEKCLIRHPSESPSEFFEVAGGQVVGTSTPVAGPPPAPDHLYLVRAAALPAFRPVFDALSHMGFYNFEPERMRDPQPRDSDEMLARDGGNIASLLARSQPNKERIAEYLAAAVPGVRSVRTETAGTKDSIKFLQRVIDDEAPWSFPATSMSDGALRVLGVLSALFQLGSSAQSDVPLVGIEEPETSLHPGAVGVLRDALREASEFKQVLVTSHSPELLDDRHLDANSILAVIARDGVTEVGPLNEATQSALRDRLYTAGELMRMEQFDPEQRNPEMMGELSWDRR